jgi:hypothetical protein
VAQLAVASPLPRPLPFFRMDSALGPLVSRSISPIGQSWRSNPFRLNRRQGRFSARGIDLAVIEPIGGSRPAKTLQ